MKTTLCKPGRLVVGAQFFGKPAAAVFAFVFLALLPATGRADMEFSGVLGYIKTSAPAGGWTILSAPFNSTGAGDALSMDEFLPDAPTGTKVWFYVTDDYETETKTAFQGWLPGTHLLARGQAVFVQVPDPEGVETVTFTTCGEVPTVADYPETTLHLVGGAWRMLSFPYPEGRTLSSTQLGRTATPGDRLIYWDPDALNGTGDWVNAVWCAYPEPHWSRDITLEAGAGYFHYRSGGDAEVIEPVPYTAP